MTSPDLRAPEQLSSTTPFYLQAVREVLLRCGPFDDGASLRAIFADPRLRPWRNQVPSGLNPEDRANRLIDLLHDEYTTDGSPALARFLEILAASRDPADVCHQDLLLQAEAVERALSADGDDLPSPFKGLQYYDVADADLFFGREAVTATLLRQIAAAVHAPAGQGPPRFLAVVGASGSGKSSLVRAGLIPALQRGRAVDGTQPPANSRRWLIKPFTPGDQPLKALARPLVGWLDPELSETARLVEVNRLAAALQEGTIAVADVVQHLLAERGEEGYVLLVVDQFEEIFTLCHDDEARRAFVDCLLAAVSRDSAGRVIVVITLRADFYHRCAAFSGLRDLLSERQLYIGPMAEAELRRAIEGPAERFNWKLEEGLVDRILDDVGDEPGALPLLSHALHETWRRRQGRTLTHAGYGAVGGVRGAIARSAENLYAQMAAEQQELARLVLLRLVELGGPSLPDTRGRAARDTLLALAEDPASVQAVLDRLCDQRLVILGEDSVEVAHEALIREWPRLQRWLDENRERLRRHEELREAADRWLVLERDRGALLRGAPLALAQSLAADAETRLGPLEEEYLAASEAAIAAEEQLKVRARQRIRRAALFGLLGGGLAASFNFLITYGRQLEVHSFLYRVALLSFLPGAVSGLLLVVLVDTVLGYTTGRSRPLRILLGGLAGALALLPYISYHTLLVSTAGFTPLLRTLPQGLMWGFVAGLGRGWLRREQLPLWQSLPLVALAGAVALVVGEQFGNAFQEAPLLAVAVAGALLPLAVLGLAELANVSRADRELVYGKNNDFLV